MKIGSKNSCQVCHRNSDNEDGASDDEEIVEMDDVLPEPLKIKSYKEALSELCSVPSVSVLERFDCNIFQSFCRHFFTSLSLHTYEATYIAGYLIPTDDRYREHPDHIWIVLQFVE